MGVDWLKSFRPCIFFVVGHSQTSNMCRPRSSRVLDGSEPVHVASPMEPFDDKASKPRRVRFADENDGVPIAEVIEVESLSEISRFTKEDKANVEASWRAELLEQLVDGN